MSFGNDNERRFTRGDLLRVGCLSALIALIGAFFLLRWFVAGIAASSPGQ